MQKNDIKICLNEKFLTEGIYEESQEEILRKLKIISNDLLNINIKFNVFKKNFGYL